MRFLDRLKKMGIREQILASFTVFTIIALGSVAATSGIFIAVIGAVTSEQTTAALEEQVQYDMQNKTFSNSLIINEQLEKVEKDMEGLAEAVSNVFKYDYDYAYRKSYYHMEMLPEGTTHFNGTTMLETKYFPQNMPPDYYYDSFFELNTSYSYSHYLIYDDTYQAMGQDEYNLTGIHGEIINRTAHLDPFMTEILKRNPHYSWIYIDFEIGIQRTLPWTGVDTTVFGPEWYDYKEDDWYIDAKAANGNAVWTSPYIDPYIGWVVSLSIGAYNGSSFVGVIGVDFTLEVITDTVGDIEMFETGYGVLIDQDGQVISHPEVEFKEEEEDATLIQDVEPITDDTLKEMTKGKIGFTIFTKEGEDYYITYAPIPISGYSLGIIVPAEEVLAPVRALQESIIINLIIQLIVIFVFLGVIVGLALIIGRRIADSVVKPIHKLTQLALKLSTEDVKKTALEESTTFKELDEIIEQDDEIGGLTQSFKNLLTMVHEDALAEKKRKSNKD